MCDLWRLWRQPLHAERDAGQTWDMDEAKVERVRAYVASLPEHFNSDGRRVVVRHIDARDCEGFRAKWEAKATLLRLTDDAAAEFAEKTAEFWETAAAVLKDAGVQTFGELLED